MKDRSKSHDWMTYVNPRNGKIRITACSKCGSINVPLIANRECSQSRSESSRLTSWRPIVEKDAQKEEAA